MLGKIFVIIATIIILTFAVLTIGAVLVKVSHEPSQEFLVIIIVLIASFLVLNLRTPR